MRTRSRVWAAALSTALAACGGVVRPGDPDGATPSPDATVVRDGSVDSAVVDTGARPDVTAPVCPPGTNALGTCQGQTIVRCSNGAVSMEVCAADQRCQPSTGGAPARCASMPVGMVTISGRVTYSRRPISRMGLGPVQMDFLPNVPVTLIDASNTTIATGVTDGMGFYNFTAPLADGATVTIRVTASRADSTYRFQIENFGGAAYSASTGQFQVMGPMVTRDIAIPEMANGGAFAIFDTIRGGLDFVRRVLPSQAPMLRVRWERGRTPPGGTSYFVPGRNYIYLLGGPMDIDEYDRPVILHEFGHFVEANYSRTSSPGGSHDGSPTDPRLAWGEGWGTWFGCAANNSSDYIDTNIDGSVRNRTDLANVAMVRNNMGDPMLPLTQNVGEYLVGGSLWALSSAGMDPNAQIAKVLNVSLRYFTRMPAPDRGVTGVDFVDFLDGYLCVNMGADRPVIEQYVVMQRQFPYDFNFAGVCR
ncbi:MAG: hypothetical protein U0269_02845 [Polyangiales bacterium]